MTGAVGHMWNQSFSVYTVGYSIQETDLLVLSIAGPNKTRSQMYKIEIEKNHAMA